MLIGHLVKLLHTTFIEGNVLLNVDFVSIHDVSETVGNLVGKIFSFNLILCWHKTNEKFGILLTEQLAHVVNLFQVWLVRLLVLTNVALHDITNVNKAFVCVFLRRCDFTLHFICVGHNFFKLCTNCAIRRSQMSQSLEV